MIRTGLFLSCFLSIGAWAKPAPKSKVPSPAEDLATPKEIVVPVPQSDIRQELMSKEESPKETRWGLGATSWTPKNISLPSYLPGDTEFKKGKAPQLLLEYFHPLLEKSMSLSYRIALTYLRLKRAAPPSGKIAGTSRQSLYLMTLPLGLEARSKSLDFSYFSPFLQMNLIPAWGLSSKSNLEGGSSSLGLFYEGKLGLLTWLKVFDGLGANRYFLSVAGGVNGGSLRSSQNIQGFFEGSLQLSF